MASMLPPLNFVGSDRCWAVVQHLVEMIATTLSVVNTVDALMIMTDCDRTTLCRKSNPSRSDPDRREACFGAG